MRPIPQELYHYGGVNLNKDSRVVRPDQLALSRNAYPVIPGILGKRKGIGAFRIGAYTAGSRTVFVQSWAVAPSVTGFAFVAHVHIGRIAERRHYLIATDFKNLAATGIANYVVYDLGLGQSSYEPVQFVNYRNTVIAVVPGTEGFVALTPKPAGGYEWILNTFKFDSAIVGVQNSQNIEVQPRKACQYKQRMVWGNFGPGRGNWICFADKATSTVLAPLLGHSLAALVGSDALALNGRHVEVGSIEGEDITAMQEITQGAVGSAVESLLMLLTERSCVYISGEILQTNDSGATDPNGLFGTYKEHRVNYECGCVSQSTLTKTPYGWIWAGPDDVWLLSGNFPIRIGTNIRPALLACPSASRKHWSAAYADGMYVLQLVTTSAGVSDFNSSVDSHLHEYWFLDLRDGPPQSAEAARWWGPMVNELDADQNVAFGKLLSIRDTDGSEQIIVPGQILDTAPAGYRDLVLYSLLNGGVKDDLLPGVVTANEWQPETAYRPGDIVRPRLNSVTVGRHFCLHVCTATQFTLSFTGQTVNFTVGQVVTGLTTGATGTIVSVVDNGAEGTLTLSGVSGTFANGESLLDALGGNGVAGTFNDGVSGSSDPTWSVSSGGTTTDNNVTWNEIRGVNEALGIRLETGRAVGEFQTDIRYRDSLLNNTIHEKLVRRLDLSASANSKMELTVTVLRDQGNAPKSLGSGVFGGHSLELDVDVLPSVIGGLKSTAKAFRPSENELIQCRSAQIKINDETTFIIDDTNDYFVIEFMQDLGSGLTSLNLVLQVQLTHGSYATMSAVLAELVARLNEVDYTSTGMTVGATPWSVSTIYGVTLPYLPRLEFAFTSLGLVKALCPLFGDDTLVNGVPTIGTVDDTLYFNRCKRLAGMLGFYTAQETYDDIIPESNVLPSPTSFGFIVDSGFGSPLSYDGVQIVHLYNTNRFDIGSAHVIIQPKNAIPLSTRSRS